MFDLLDYQMANGHDPFKEWLADLSRQAGTGKGSYPSAKHGRR
jgi:hypothetical protein